MEHDKITVVLNDVSPLYYKDQKLFLKPSEAEAKILAKFVMGACCWSGH